MTAFTLKQIAEILADNRFSASHEKVIVTDFSIDSRKVKKGALFIALKGEKFDGHDFIAEAAQQGAVAAIVEVNSEKKIVNPSALPLLFVEESKKALALLAKVWMELCRPITVAVTGSVGKTSTKDFIATLLQGSKKVFSSPGNANSQIGLPLSLLNGISKETEIAVLEMGMDHPGQISKLVEIAPPKIAVLTAVEWVHGSNFSSLQEIAKAKAEIFSSPFTEYAVISSAIEDFPLVENCIKCPLLSYSLYDSSAAVFLDSGAYENTMELCWGEEKRLLPKLALPGIHNKHNFLAAAIAARLLGLSWDLIADRIPDLKLAAKRLEKKEIGGVCFIDDSYNACEASIKAALCSIKELTDNKGKIYAILGDMFEMGERSSQLHRSVAEYALEYADVLVGHGDAAFAMVQFWQNKSREAFWSSDKNELVLWLKNRLLAEDIVLVKGSNGMRMWEIIELYSQYTLSL